MIHNESAGVCEEEIERHVKDYLNFLNVERGLAEGTISAYSSYLGAFLGSLEAKDLSEITNDDIRDYMGREKDRGYPRGSIGPRVAAIKGFFAFLLREGTIQHNPAQSIESPKREHKLPRFLTEEQIEWLFDIVEDPRDRVIVEILYASGIRASELLNLQNGDIDLKNMTLRVREAKNGQERIAYINKSAAEAIQAYKKLEPWDELFLDNGTRGNLNWIIREYGERIGVDLHPHMFRHTFATHLLNNGADIMTVKELLGHKDINATMIYSHVSQEKLKKDHVGFFENEERIARVRAIEERRKAIRHTREDLLKKLWVVIECQEKKGKEAPYLLSAYETAWIMELTGYTITRHIRAGQIKAPIMSDGVIPFGVDSKHVEELLTDAPYWLQQAWEQSRKIKKTRKRTWEEHAKRAYKTFKRHDRLPHPNANLTAENRSKYYSYDEMADILGVSYTTYGRKIRPLVKLLFLAEKRIQKDLLMSAVEREFDNRNRRKALPEAPDEILEAEYQVAG
ncbi:MAG: site-specific tyrosine recombinase/integron integrase [Candidatus Omnitrophota bacterium]